MANPPAIGTIGNGSAATGVSVAVGKAGEGATTTEACVGIGVGTVATGAARVGTGAGIGVDAAATTGLIVVGSVAEFSVATTSRLPLRMPISSTSTTYFPFNSVGAYSDPKTRTSIDCDFLRSDNSSANERDI